MRILFALVLAVALWSCTACARRPAVVPTLVPQSETTDMPSANTPIAAPPSFDALTISLQSGTVRGIRENDLSVFKGIPYAAPPVGELRWREPQPAPAWQGVRAADAFGKACIQPTAASMEGAGAIGPQSEDCLFLNVWTPDTDAGAKLPVMVWIHGGALRLGASSSPLYDGAALAQRGAVVVNFNYRLGPLGFFSHPALAQETRNGPVNFGLLDEIAALKWVRQNIAAFGGDPNNVTLFGESAGGQSVLALFASPLAQGLFQRGIAESPYGIPGHTRNKAQDISINVANAAGLNGAQATLQELRAVPAEKFSGITAKDTSLAPSFVYGDAALPAPILDIFQQGKQAAVPLIIGSNSDEATVATAFGIDPAKLIEKLGLAKIALRALYPGVTDNAELGRQVIRDLIFTAFVKRIADVHAPRAPAWRYYFSYVPQNMRGGQSGVSHGGEIVFVMGTGELAPAYKTTLTDADRAMSKRVGDYWFEFARSGKPNPANEPVWNQADADHNVVMEFGDTLALQNDFMKPRLDVFIGLLNALGKLLDRE